MARVSQVLSIACMALIASATQLLAVSQTSQAYTAKYDGASSSCSQCHAGGGLARRSNGGQYNSYGTALLEALRADQGVTGGAESNLNDMASTIRALEAIEPTYAPRISAVSVDGQTVALGGSGPRTVTAPAGATTLRVTFTPGLAVSGSTAALTQAPLSGPSGFQGAAVSGASVTVTLTLPLASRTGTSTLNFTPANNARFFPTVAATRALSSLQVSFANGAPTPVADAATLATATTPLAINVLANDSDPDGDSLTVVLAGGNGAPSAGSVSLAGGVATYTPPSPPLPTARIETFRYSLVDGRGLASATEATVTVTIPALQQPPVAVDDAFTVTEDQPLSGNVLTAGAGDSDPNGDALTAALLTQPDRGVVALNPNGAFTYTPPPDYTGDGANRDSFTYTVSDGTASATGTVTLTFTPVNDPPVAVNDALSAAGQAGATTTGNVLQLGVDTDVDGDTLQAVLESDAGLLGSVALNLDGTFVYTAPGVTSPTVRTTSFTYRARDPAGATSAPATVTISIQGFVPANQPPVAVDDAFTVTEDTALSGNVITPGGGAAPDVDPDPGVSPAPLSVSLAANPVFGALVLNPDGSFTYTPNANATGDANGRDSFRYTLSDGGATATGVVTLTFTPVNDAPVAVDDVFTTAATGVLNGNVLTQGVDTDVEGDALTVASSGPASIGSVTLSSDGNFAYTPPFPPFTSPQTATFTYRVTDGAAASNEATVTIAILAGVAGGQPPVAVADAFTVVEDMVFSGNVIMPAGAAPDTDPEGDPLTAQALTQPVFGVLALNLDGSFTYTPFLNATGDGANTDRFTYTLSDGVNATTGEVTLTFTPVNDAPVAATIITPAVNTGQGPQTIDLLDPRFVSDAEGDALTVSAVTVAVIAPTLNDAAQPFTVNGATLSFDPAALSALDANETAELRFSYTVSDGVETTAAQAVVSVIGLGSAVGRVAGQYADSLAGRYNFHFDPSTVQEGSCLNCHNPGRVDVRIRTVADCRNGDLNSFGLALCLDRDPQQPPLTDLLRRLQAQEARFAPRLTAAPALTVPDDSAVGAPLGAPLSQVTAPGLTVDGAPAAIHSFLIENGGGFAATDATGQFSVDAAGQLRVAGPLTAGVYTLDVRPVNDAGQRNNAGAVVSGRPGFIPLESQLLRFVTVTVVGAAPTAAADAVNTTAGQSVTIAVTANDVGTGIASVAVASPPANGSVTGDGALGLVYTPAAGFTGQDSFTYTAANAAGASAPATVTITVLPAGAPLARDDEATVFAETPAVIDVLANDEGAADTVSIVQGPGSGVATVGADNAITYTPNAGFGGADMLVYRASNAVGASTATLRITVNVVNGDFLAAATQDPELRRVAQAIGDDCAALNAAGTPSGDAADLVGVCAGLASDVRAGGGIDAALSAIRNEEALAASDSTMSIARATGATLGRRLDALRSGRQRGLQVTELSLRLGDDGDPSLLAQEAAMALSPALEDAFAAGWGGFIAGDIVLGDADGDSRSQGFDLLGFSLSIGVDKQVRPDLTLGVALSYGQGDVDFNGGGGLDSQSIEISVYGFYDGFAAPGLSLAGYGGYGFDDYEQDRRIAFASASGPVDRTATSDYGGDHVMLGAVLDLDIGEAWMALQDEGAAPADVTPPVPGDFGVFVSIDYFFGQTDGYTEAGAGGLNLRVDDQDFDSLQIAIGGRAAHAFNTPQGVLEPFGAVSLGAELLDDERVATSRFAVSGPGGSAFVVREDGSESFIADATVGVRLYTAEAAYELSYATNFGQGRIRSNRFAGRVGTQLLGGDELLFSLGGDIGADGAPEAEARVDYAIRW